MTHRSRDVSRKIMHWDMRGNKTKTVFQKQKNSYLIEGKSILFMLIVAFNLSSHMFS